MTIEIDRSIINRVLNGDINAFGELIEMHKDDVFNIICKRVPAQDVDHLAHDVFVRAYQSLHTYKGKSPFANWLARISVYSCYDYWKAREKDGLVTAPIMHEDHTEWLELVSTDHASDVFIKENYQREIREMLDYTLQQLGVDDRLVLEMYYIEQWSMKEIARSLRWSLAKVKIRAMRARQKMRRIISDFMEKEVDNEEA